jgi:hypothetical protein
MQIILQLIVNTKIKFNKQKVLEIIIINIKKYKKNPK